MILQELVQHVEEIVLHQRLNHQLIQVMLKDTRQQQVCPEGSLENRTASSANCLFYLHSDLELVQRADVLHQHRNDEFMGDALQSTEQPTSERSVQM